ncbi:MAG TPA: hypothetical protein VJC12_02025 [Candidatus Paceibacterota bacterium]
MSAEKYTPSDEEVRLGQEMSDLVKRENDKEHLKKSGISWLKEEKARVERESSSEIDYLSAVHGTTGQTRAQQKYRLGLLDEVLKELQLESDIRREAESMSVGELEKYISLFTRILQKKKGN